jgi:hypothetical protein
VAHFLLGQEIFLISKTSRLTVRSTQPVEYRGLFPRGKVVKAW